MYLHKDKQLFEDVINATSDKYSIETAIVEKDYYVTMILKLLAEKSGLVVFKGGTSLSKCFQAINRFSEDIDITFSEHIGEARRKKLKYNVMKIISDELELPIENWNKIESDRDLNQYLYQYIPITGTPEETMFPTVKVEIALGSYSFPVEEKSVSSYVYRYLLESDEKELIEEYELSPFKMHVQSLERTYIDKVFALCDYYIQGKSKRYSRHMYDLYKLQTFIHFGKDFAELVNEVREHRADMGEKLCPSAQKSVSVPKILKSLCEEDFFKEDYETITEYFVQDMVTYDEAKENILGIAENPMFE